MGRTAVDELETLRKVLRITLAERDASRDCMVRCADVLEMEKAAPGRDRRVAAVLRAAAGATQAPATATAVASDFDLPEPDRDHDPRDLDYWLRWEGA